MPHTILTPSSTIETFPIIGPQLGIWLADQFATEQNTFTVAQYVELRGDIDIKTLQKAIKLGLSEADTIHSSYKNKPEGSIQIIPSLPAVEKIADVAFVNLSSVQNDKEEALLLMQKDIHQATRASDSTCLYKHKIFMLAPKEGENRFFWYQRYHHLAIDGFSFTALTQRIAIIYTALTSQQPIGNSPFTAYANVINEYMAYESSEKKEKDKVFWQNYCQYIPAQESLSYRKSLNNDGLNTSVIRHKLSVPTDIVKQINSRVNLSIADITSAAVLVYISKITQQKTVCIGYPLMRRMGSEALSTLGTTVNVLPLSLEVSPESTLDDITRLLKNEIRKIRRHQKYESEQIHHDLGRTGGNKRLYSATLNCKLFDYTLDFSGVIGNTHQLATGPIEDIEFGVYVNQGELSIELSANSSRYTKDELNLHGERLTHLLKQYCVDSASNIQSLSLITPKEIQKITKWSKRNDLNTSQYGSSIIALLENQVEHNAYGTAVVFGEKELTFAELSCRVNQLSRLLLTYDVKPGDLVAVALPRSIDSIISIFAIMAVGGVYLPLDLNHPPERLAMMCEDKVPSIALTLDEQQHLLPNTIECVCLNNSYIIELLNACYSSHLKDYTALIEKKDIAYVFYTSGSTGRPKGVTVSHGGLINLVAALEEAVYSSVYSQQDDNGKSLVNKQLNVALTGSLSFDTSWDPIILMLLGHTLHLYADEVKQDVFELLNLIEKDKIDTMAVAPSLATQLVQAGLCEKTQHKPLLMTICGEPVSPFLWQALLHSSISAHNIYGPTEFTVYATSKEITPQSSEVLIGKPFANTYAYVLDQNLNSVPIGMNGELYLAGDNMSLGYLNRPEITATKFVANPFVAGDVMYTTGDIVRWSTEGELVFVGRCDNQVKVRGYRIELGDVEAALSCLNVINEVAVIVDETENGNRLLAYCTTSDHTLSKEEVVESIYDQLSATLPVYMVPAIVTVLAEMPLTVSGKINKKMLPKPEVTSESLSLPTTHEEIVLCEEIGNILGLESVGIDNDFFKMAGDSISAMRLSIAMRKKGFELKAQDIFSERTPKKMASLMSDLSLSTELDINAQSNINMPTSDEVKLLVEKYGEQSIILPTLPLQAGLLFHTQYAEEDSQYSFTTKITLKGQVDPSQLQHAIAHLIVKYPQLAAKFDVDITGKPLQLIPNMSLDDAYHYCRITEHDFRHLEQEPKQKALHAIEMKEAYRNFSFSHKKYTPDTDEGRLFFVNLVRMSELQYEVVITAHHLIIDGWSTPILLRDLFSAYQHIESLKTSTENTYQDIVYQMVNRTTQHAEQAWKKALAQVTPTIVYPNSKHSSHVSELHCQLDTSLTTKVNEYCQAHGITLNTLIQGAWAAQLGSLTSRDNVVFGSPVSGRFSDINGIDEQVGLFSNTLPVSVKLNTTETILSQLINLQNQQINLISHDCLGLGEIQRLVNADNLFDTLLVVENYPVQESLLSQSFNGLSIEHVENRGYTHYPLTILVLPGEQIRVLFEYKEVVTEPKGLADAFIQIIAQIVNAPSLRLQQLTMQTEYDTEIINTANDTFREIPTDSLRDLLRNQAAQSPSAIALKDNTKHFTYQEMRHVVEHVALQLLADTPLSDSIIGVSIPRSCDLSIALQSVIEVGAAYLPLDSTYPDERLAMMLQDAKVKLLITTREQLSRFTEGEFSQLPMKVILIESLINNNNEQAALNDISPLAERVISASTPAYVIYTSGSTGRPKGVVVSHQSIVNRLLWMQHEYNLASSDVVLQKTPSSFDVSVWEFFWPLIQGACLYMAPPEAHRDPQLLLNTMITENITTLHFVPSMLAAFIDSVGESPELAEMNRKLKRIFCSGEALSTALVAKFKSISDVPLHNLYGPTEAAVDVTYFDTSIPFDSKLQGVPIGKPVWNTELKILDHQLRAVGVGATGELYLSGTQLANGYLHRPELTADRFIADPFKHGQRMYRTGDLAKWLPNGNVVYLGRTDDQLKIRGLRVEIGEIEQALLQLTGVKQAAVHARELISSNVMNSLEDNRQLIGYFSRKGDEETPLAHSEGHSEMLAELSLVLPAHMVPVTLIEVRGFPLSANGKLDRKSLPDPEQSLNVVGRDPDIGAETIIAKEFEKLLNVEKIFVEDNFFSLGGHSLMAMKLAANLRATLVLPVSVGQIMVSPTVAGLAEVLLDETLRQDPEKAGFGHVLPIRQGQGNPLICINPGSGFSWQYTGFPKYLVGNYPIIGLQSPRPNGAVAISEDMNAAVMHYYNVLKQVQPHGPYHFLGYSFGGTVAMALASKLEQQGEKVAFVGLLDTYPPEGQEWKGPTEEEANEEVEREKRQFLASAESNLSDEASLAEQNKMFGDIVANYGDTVRLLSNASTQVYQGKVHLFVAEKTLPKGWNVERSWAPFIKNLVQFRLPFAHDNILSPESLQSIGPMLNELVITELGKETIIEY
ncbi:non-ribosomal peptide synthetase [Colwellia sp. UCD-KL20]|uniref:non-ribosomal peptide synthetase n=1 Tax=Colwellia sp. UCD-KL20 TaxID=1917165 RepID=UPI0009713FB2|nr:non-ribosomal peptide synthetase [Colwellia sp. UCD-KL20]